MEYVGNNWFLMAIYRFSGIHYCVVQADTSSSSYWLEFKLARSQKLGEDTWYKKDRDARHTF